MSVINTKSAERTSLKPTILILPVLILTLFAGACISPAELAKTKAVKELFFKEGANKYESEAIAFALGDMLTEGFKTYLQESHFVFGMYSDLMDCRVLKQGKCRQHLSYRVKFVTASIDLNGDNRDEVIVEVIAPNMCGSGGCTYYILQIIKDKWKNIGEIFGGFKMKISNNRKNGFSVINYIGKLSGPHECVYAKGRYSCP